MVETSFSLDTEYDSEYKSGITNPENLPLPIFRKFFMANLSLLNVSHNDRLVERPFARHTFSSPEESARYTQASDTYNAWYSAVSVDESLRASLTGPERPVLNIEMDLLEKGARRNVAEVVLKQLQDEDIKQLYEDSGLQRLVQDNRGLVRSSILHNRAMAKEFRAAIGDTLAQYAEYFPSGGVTGDYINDKDLNVLSIGHIDDLIRAYSDNRRGIMDIIAENMALRLQDSQRHSELGNKLKEVIKDYNFGDPDISKLDNGIRGIGKEDEKAIIYDADIIKRIRGLRLLRQTLGEEGFEALLQLTDLSNLDGGTSGTSADDIYDKLLAELRERNGGKSVERNLDESPGLNEFIKKLNEKGVNGEDVQFLEGLKDHTYSNVGTLFTSLFSTHISSNYVARMNRFFESGDIQQFGVEMVDFQETMSRVKGIVAKLEDHVVMNEVVDGILESLGKVIGSLEKSKNGDEFKYIDPLPKFDEGDNNNTHVPLWSLLGLNED